MADARAGELLLRRAPVRSAGRRAHFVDEMTEALTAIWVNTLLLR